MEQLDGWAGAIWCCDTELVGLTGGSWIEVVALTKRQKRGVHVWSLNVRRTAKHCIGHINSLVTHIWLHRCCGSQALGVLMSLAWGVALEAGLCLKLPVGSINLASLTLRTEGIVAVNMDNSWEIVQNEESASLLHSGDFEIGLIQKNLHLRNPERVQKKLEVLCQPAELLFGSDLAFTFHIWCE